MGLAPSFRKWEAANIEKALNAYIKGSYVYDAEERFFVPQARTRRRQERTVSSLRYQLSFELSASVDLDVIGYQRQTLSAWKRLGRDLSDGDYDVPDLQIMMEAGDTEEPMLTVERFAFEKFDAGLRFRFSEPPKLELRESPKLEIEDFLRHILGRGDEFMIPRLGSFILDFRYLRDDFAGGEIFNIIPSQVRMPEDSAKAPFIQNDGSGLAATLYALQKNIRRTIRSGESLHSVRRMLPVGTFAQIIRYMQTVNETIFDLSVRNDPFDNQLKVGVKISGEDAQIELPFSSMSDGTVKWASLITAILTYETIFAIEEPENFLHPLMQREILQIMRENVERRGGQSFVIMTTHSETLLNAANPNEVVVVSNQNGITHAKRPEDPERLRAEIQRSGFGLGYVYVSGALENA